MGWNGNPGEFLDELSAYKTKLGEPGKDGGNRQPESEKERAEEDAFAEYQRGLQEEGLLDFDDILLKALETAKDTRKQTGRFSPACSSTSFRISAPCSTVWSRHGTGTGRNCL